MALIFTTLGEIDEDLLRRTDGKIDNDNECTIWTEHCLKDCDGPAHQSNQPDEPWLFCQKHVKREVHITLKQGISLMSAVGEING
jgi:hypothetical protein